MQAFKLKGTIDEAGKLTVAEPVDLTPGEVEVILLKVVVSPDKHSASASNETKLHEAGEDTFKTKVKAFADWFEKVPPAPQDFDADDARWQALKEKYNL